MPRGERMSPPTRVMYAIFDEGPRGRILRYGPPNPWHRAGLLLGALIIIAAMIYETSKSSLALWTAVTIFVLIFMIVPVGWAYAQYWNRRHPDLVREQQTRDGRS
jgi:hypothetical protein